MVDVQVETVINRPQDHVAEYAGNPDNAPEWYSNIKSVKWQTQRPMAVGSKLAFSARFLGRSNTGSPAGYSKIAGAVMAPMMRLAMRKDLRKLKELLESS
jgi:hypothetical protein